MPQTVSPKNNSVGNPAQVLHSRHGDRALPPQRRPHNGSKPAGAEHAGAGVYVVEDEALISMYLCERLNAMGYNVCGSAPSGELALRQIPGAHPDLVLMDVNLAGQLDGVATALRLGEHNQVPVVFLTAYADSDLVQQVARSKAYGYLVKPFDERELHATIQVAMERARANAELEQRVAERTSELRDAVADVESFSHMVAHELRGPFFSLSGFTKLILEEHATGLDEDATQMLQLMDRELRRMGALTSSLLEFSTRTRKPVVRTPVAMRALVEDAVRELRSLRSGQNIRMRLGNLPDARCDPVLTRQIWRNLLENAFKFSAARNPAIVMVDFQTESGAWFVRDNGVGFDTELADQLFRPFSRLHTEKPFEGFGIGLATVERIVRAHGGRAWAESSPGAGACFYFTLGDQA